VRVCCPVLWCSVLCCDVQGLTGTGADKSLLRSDKNTGVYKSGRSEESWRAQICLGDKVNQGLMPAEQRHRALSHQSAWQALTGGRAGEPCLGTGMAGLVLMAQLLLYTRSSWQHPTRLSKGAKLSPNLEPLCAATHPLQRAYQLRCMSLGTWPLCMSLGTWPLPSVTL
jgi:hypothetical protein